MNLYKYACALNNIPRFSGKHLTQYVGGAEHSYRVAILAMIIVDNYNLENDNKINVEEVLRKALIHDIEEAITGDIPTPVKKFKNFRKIYRELAISLISSEILQGLKDKIKALYLKMWEEDKDGESGEVIQLADKMEAFLNSYFELKRGNHTLEKPYKNCGEFFFTEEGKRLLNKFPVAIDILRPAVNINPKYLLKVKPFNIENSLFSNQDT